ncbi:hypothetical protein EX30DRAFT_159167 [Ascodesmis nigricans]|uniref:Uncharacterized protein n=1 Tax=Ascodesmis nigricans TaxID=341454 RepID=A0A4S2MMK5_9PEZI|nr:hypothetical protein EX30DRAFT_159167 [Ascodesmis nigricans]
MMMMFPTIFSLQLQTPNPPTSHLPLPPLAKPPSPHNAHNPPTCIPQPAAQPSPDSPPKQPRATAHPARHRVIPERVVGNLRNGVVGREANFFFLKLDNWAGKKWGRKNGGV